MAVTATPALPQTPKSAKVQILPAGTTAVQTLYTGGSNGSKVTAVIVSSSDTSARDVQLGITNTAVFYPLCTVTIPITAGQVTGTAPVNMLSITNLPGLPVDNDGQPYIYLTSASDVLGIKSLTTVTTAKEIDVTAFGADF